MENEASEFIRYTLIINKVFTLILNGIYYLFYFVEYEYWRDIGNGGCVMGQQGTGNYETIGNRKSGTVGP